jgi:hypothetical protein
MSKNSQASNQSEMEKKIELEIKKRKKEEGQKRFNHL